MEPPILLYGSLDSSISAVRQAAGKKLVVRLARRGHKGDGGG